MVNIRKSTSEQAALSRSALDWSIAIITSIPDPHMQGWVASIITWDADKPEYWKQLGPIIEQYDRKKVDTFHTVDIVAALNSVGYTESNWRCELRQDNEREQCGRKIGTNGAPDSRFYDRGRRGYIIAVG